MAKFAATDVSVTINSQDISDWCVSVDLPDSKAQIDVSGFNSTGAMEFVPGARDQTVILGVLQDFGGTKIHQLLNPLYTGNSAFAFSIKPTSAAVSATNPQFTGTANIYEYDGLNAQLNARAEITVTLKPASNSVWAWATA